MLSLKLVPVDTKLLEQVAREEHAAPVDDLDREYEDWKRVASLARANMKRIANERYERVQAARRAEARVAMVCS